MNFLKRDIPSFIKSNDMLRDSLTSWRERLKSMVESTPESFQESIIKIEKNVREYQEATIELYDDRFRRHWLNESQERLIDDNLERYRDMRAEGL